MRSWPGTTGAASSCGSWRASIPIVSAGVIGVNTPDLPRSAMPPVQLLRQIFVDTPIYIIQFQERGVAEWMLGSWGRGADDFVEMIFGATTQNRRRVPARGARRLQGRVPSDRRAHAADRVLPEHGSQLGAHRRDRRSHDRRAVPHDLGRERSGAHARDDRRHGRARARSRTRRSSRTAGTGPNRNARPRRRRRCSRTSAASHPGNPETLPTVVREIRREALFFLPTVARNSAPRDHYCAQLLGGIGAPLRCAGWWTIR